MRSRAAAATPPLHAVPSACHAWRNENASLFPSQIQPAIGKPQDPVADGASRRDVACKDAAFGALFWVSHRARRAVLARHALYTRTTTRLMMCQPADQNRLESKGAPVGAPVGRLGALSRLVNERRGTSLRLSWSLYGFRYASRVPFGFHSKIVRTVSLEETSLTIVIAVQLLDEPSRTCLPTLALQPNKIHCRDLY